MTFPATITLTIAAVARVLTRVNQDNYGSEYQYNGATESVGLKIRHSTDPVDGDTGLVMKRHNVFVEHVVYPTPTALILKRTMTVTFRHGKYDSPTTSVELGQAVNVWLAASTNFAELGAGSN